MCGESERSEGSVGVVVGVIMGVTVPFPALPAGGVLGSAHSSSSKSRSAAPLACYSAPCTYTHTHRHTRDILRVNS